MRRASVLLATALLTACTPALEYPPPKQKVMPPGRDPVAAIPLVYMSDPEVESFVIRDIVPSEQGSAWRWTNAHPRVRIWFDPAHQWNFYLRFAIAGDAFRVIGPQTLRMMINEQLLDTQTYSQEKGYEYSKLVPQSMLSADGTAVVGIDVDPILVSQDRSKLGIILQEIGFKRADGK